MNPSNYIDKGQENLTDSAKTRKENQIVIYQGRSICPTIKNNFSLVDRMMVMVSDILEISPGKMVDVLPKGFMKMIGQMGKALNQMENPPKQNLGIFSSFMMKTIEQEVAEEEGKEATKRQIDEMFNGFVHQLGTQHEQQLHLAKVSTMTAFREKEEKVRGYQAEAEKRYLENPVNREKRKEIDQQIVRAYKEGNLSEKDALVIKNYWDYLMPTPEGQEQIEIIRARASDVFVKSMDGLMDEMADQMEQFMKQAVGEEQEKQKMKPAQFMTNYFHGFAQKTSQQWMQEREKCQTEEEKLIMDYYLLTEGSQMSAILNQGLRSILQSKLEEANRRAEGWMNYERNLSQDLIEYHMDAIKTAEEGIMDYERRYIWDKHEFLKESYLEFIQIFGEGIDDYNKTVEHEKKKTEKDFREAAYARLDENPREIRALIPKQTAFEALMLEMIKLEIGAHVNQVLGPKLILTTPDLQLDLNQIADPVEYFCQQIENKDQAKLKLLNGSY